MSLPVSVILKRLQTFKPSSPESEKVGRAGVEIDLYDVDRIISGRTKEAKPFRDRVPSFLCGQGLRYPARPEAQSTFEFDRSQCPLAASPAYGES
jgi:hypothetical protein